MSSKPEKYCATTTLATQKNFINGKYVSNQSGEVFETRYPGDDHVICSVEVAGDAEINAAVAAASNAFKTWSQMPAAERGDITKAFAEAEHVGRKRIESQLFRLVCRFGQSDLHGDRLLHHCLSLSIELRGVVRPML